MEKCPFTYSRSTITTVDWSVVVIVLVIALGSWMIYGDEKMGGVLVILIGCGLFIPLYLNARFMLSTLRVDDEGVTAVAFGHPWKSIRWDDVKKVRSAQWKNPGFQKPTKTFLICITYKNRFYICKNGPIVFNDTISEFKTLMDIIREKARLHGFEITCLQG